jgi:hypothetical protein
MAEKKSILLRLPPELWAEIKRFADAELRSVNGQIEFILREAVRKRTGKVDDEDSNEAEGN